MKTRCAGVFVAVVCYISARSPDLSSPSLHQPDCEIRRRGVD